jgi:hypothetical protein
LPIFAAFLGQLSPHCQPLFYFFDVDFFILKKKVNFGESPKIG